MTKICPYCDKSLSTKQWLDYHIARYHSSGPDESMPTQDICRAALRQWGGGAGDIFSKGKDVVSPDDADADDESSDSEMEEDDESYDKKANAVFQFIKDLTRRQLDNEFEGDTESYDLKDFRKEFRRIYASFLKWLNRLRHNEIHKKIVTSARSYREELDHDYEESIDVAVNSRKFLLDRLVTEDDLENADDIPNTI